MNLKKGETSKESEVEGEPKKIAFKQDSIDDFIDDEDLDVVNIDNLIAAATSSHQIAQSSNDKSGILILKIGF
jgi:hypothetical protein